MKMRNVDVYNNLKNYSCWDFKNYRLTEDEAKPCIDALKCSIWHPIATEGLPIQPGRYLFTANVEIYGINDTSVEVFTVVSTNKGMIVDCNDYYTPVAWAYCIEPYKEEEQ